MKVLCLFASFMSLQLVFNNGSTSGIPITGNTLSSTCTKKQQLTFLAGSILSDFRALFLMVRSNPQFKTCNITKDMFFNFSIAKNLTQDKLIKRLYLHHKELSKAYSLVAHRTTNPNIGSRIFNIIVQIKDLSQLLHNNINCNPGQPGAVGFVFNLPKQQSSSNVPLSHFLYDLAVLVREIYGDFKKNVVEYVSKFL